MKSHSLLLSAIIGLAIAAPIAATSSGLNLCGIARADEMPSEIAAPRNQHEFDQLAARLANADSAERNAQLNRAGNAFDNGESRLFWFTDLDAARAQAKRENKPILSLRLLGNLSDELSCANSRLFRVLLYPNAEINQRLHDDFVLYWSSERPVPVATIDMGDGRVFKRTLTGNSAHYLLSADGTPLDVLPGLYAPTEFAAWLQRGADFARYWRAANVDLRPQMLRDWHRGRLVDGAKARNNSDLERTTKEIELALAINLLANGKPAPIYTNAQDASLLTGPKRTMERPILNAMEAPQNALSPEVRRQNYKVPLLGDIPLIGSLFRSKTIMDSFVIFDAATRERIVAMQPENESQTLIQTLEQNVRRDTQNNKTNFEPAIDVYFFNVAAPDFVKLNRAIYDKLFRTPASDPWLGLSPSDAFVAIRNGGVQSAPDSGQRVAQNP